MASLTTKVINSLGWIFTNMMTKNVLQFARTVILWRLLDADDFGLNGMAWLAINAFTLLQDMGFQSALIQRKSDLDKAISVTWYANVVIRLVVYVILFLVAPLVAAHFDEPEVSPILRVAGVCVVIGSFGSANEALLRKNFQFKRVLVVETVELVVLFGVQVVLAWMGLGVWSLVYGTMASAAVRSLVLWRLAPIRLVKFDPAVAREMFHFGKHMTVSTLLLWLIGNMDYYFVGKFLGKAALGFYTLAFRLAFLIATNVARMLGSVLFPAFSEIGRDLDRVRTAWLRSVLYSMVLMMPMALGLIIFSRQIMLTFYKAECEVIVLPMAILTVAALCRAVGMPMGDLQKGIGRPELLTRVAFWHMVVMGPILFLITAPLEPTIRAVLSSANLSALEQSIAMAFIAPMEMWVGLSGVSAAISSVTVAVGIGLGLVLTAREVRFTAGQLLGSLKPSLFGGLAMAFTAWLGKLLLSLVFPKVPPYVELLILGPIACAAYLLALWKLFPSVSADMRNLLKRRQAEMSRRGERPQPTGAGG